MFRLLLFVLLHAPGALGGYDWKGEIRAHALKLLDGARQSLRLLPSGEDPATAHADILISEAIEALKSPPRAARR